MPQYNNNPAFRDIFKDGDDIVCRGKGFVDDMIEWVCSASNNLEITQYTHVVTVVRFTADEITELAENPTTSGLLKDYLYYRIGENKDDMVCVFEANQDGTHLTELSAWVEEYEGQMWVRHLVTERTPEMKRELLMFICDVYNMPYAWHPLELICAASGRNTAQDGKSWFCAQLSAAIKKLSTWNLLLKNRLAVNYIPNNWVPGGSVDQELLLSSKPASLGVPIEIEKGENS